MRKCGMAWKLVNKELTGCRPEEILGESSRISIVGGGGKTTLLYYLAEEVRKTGKKTVLTTTTKIYRPEQYCQNRSECEAVWKQNRYAVCGTPIPEGKLGSCNEELLGWIYEQADVVLAEADGARGMACKVPDAHEPVLLPQTDLVIGVMGLDVLGKRIEEVCFRPEQAAEFLGCPVQHVLDGDDLIRILLSERGTAKNVGATAYRIVLNKCDDAQRLNAGYEILEKLAKKGQYAILTSFGGAEKR